MALSASDTQKHPQAVAAIDGSGNPALLRIATSTARLMSAAASVNATSVKTSSGVAFSVSGRNASAGVLYVKLYNKASAPSEADTPVYTIAVGATSNFFINLGGMFGHLFDTGIGYRLTGAAADNDTTALSAGDILGFNIAYT